jgi:hypothetical protein
MDAAGKHRHANPFHPQLLHESWSIETDVDHRKIAAIAPHPVKRRLGVIEHDDLCPGFVRHLGSEAELAIRSSNKYQADQIG